MITAQNNTNAQNITLQIQEEAKLELVKGKEQVKNNTSEKGSMGWLAHLSKILEVFEAIDKSNALMNKEDETLEKTNSLKVVLYNAIKNCTSLDQLMDFLNNFKKSLGSLEAQDPSLANLVSNLGSMIYSAEQQFLSKPGSSSQSAAYYAWKNEELPAYTNILQGFSLEGSKATQAIKSSSQDSQSEQSTLVSAMNTLATMSVQSLTDQNASSESTGND